MATLTHAPANPGRNRRCPCGSGRKYKQCCLPATPAARDPAPPDEYREHLRQAHALIRSARTADALKLACVHLRAACRLRPQAPEPLSDLGAVLARLGHPAAAFTCYRQALALDAAHAAALSNLGALQQGQGDHAEAVRSLKAALACDPKLTDAHVNLAAALNSLGLFDEAIHHAECALAFRPDDLDALLNLGNAYKQQGRLARAAGVYRRAAAHAADPRPLSNLAETLRDQGAIDAADAAYREALLRHPGDAAVLSNLLYLHAFAHDLPPGDELALARCWEQAVLMPAERRAARQAAARDAGIFTPNTGPRLRLGIVSAELGSHAVAEFLQPFLEELDRSLFHLTLFPAVGHAGNRAAHLRSLADTCLPLTGLTDADATALIRSQRIDVLLDTSGHTNGNRLGVFARRAAPVQCTWIGYWATTGLTEMDYALSDPTAPPDADGCFAEELFRLPRLNACYCGDGAFAIDWRPDPQGAVRLGSLNKFAKIREETVALWAECLRQIPRARLVLEDRGSDETESHARLRTAFALHGISVDRIEFLPYLPGHERHMLLYNQIDIALDTLPFNSGTTAFDTLWMGVPLVALEGSWTGGRIASSVLRALDRPEWIANTPQHFAAIVQSLAAAVPTQAARLQQRQRMLARPLCDAVTLTRAVESAFTAMYDRWLTAESFPIW